MKLNGKNNLKEWFSLRIKSIKWRKTRLFHITTAPALVIVKGPRSCSLRTTMGWGPFSPFLFGGVPQAISYQLYLWFLFIYLLLIIIHKLGLRLLAIHLLNIFFIWFNPKIFTSLAINSNMLLLIAN